MALDKSQSPHALSLRNLARFQGRKKTLDENLQFAQEVCAQYVEGTIAWVALFGTDDGDNCFGCSKHIDKMGENWESHYKNTKGDCYLKALKNLSTIEDPENMLQEHYGEDGKLLYTKIVNPGTRMDVMQGQSFTMDKEARKKIRKKRRGNWGYDNLEEREEWLGFRESVHSCTVGDKCYFREKRDCPLCCKFDEESKKWKRTKDHCAYCKKTPGKLEMTVSGKICGIFQRKDGSVKSLSNKNANLWTDINDLIWQRCLEWAAENRPEAEQVQAAQEKRLKPYKYIVVEYDDEEGDPWEKVFIQIDFDNRIFNTHLTQKGIKASSQSVREQMLDSKASAQIKTIKGSGQKGLANPDVRPVDDAAEAKRRRLESTSDVPRTRKATKFITTVLFMSCLVAGILTNLRARSFEGIPQYD